MAVLRIASLGTLLGGLIFGFVLITGAGAKAAAAPKAVPDLPVVWVFSTGGTISGAGSSPTDLSNYKSGSLTGTEIVKSVPEVAKLATIKVEQIVNASSNDMTVETWLTLAHRINEVYADPKVAGVVVTHGTSTLEETAYFLNLTVKDSRPVVMVGAMRPPTAISADGPLNLLNAVRVATAPEARGKGALIVLNDEINAAREGTKTNTYRVETFRAPELGLLGYVDEDRIAFYRSPTRRHTTNSEFDVSALKTLPRVDILYSYAEPNTAMFKALVDSGDKGIVFAGTGAGGLSRFEKDAVKSFAPMQSPSRPVIVRASRTGNGRVIATSQYDELDLIPGDNLNPQRARILLMLALSKTHDTKEIRRIFSEY